MTKLSDALRGAADRAPLGGATVSSDVAARRISRQRGMRGAANGLVGVGAVALLAFGIMAPGVGGMPGESAADAPATRAGDGEEDAAAPEMLTRLAWGACGSYALDYGYFGEPRVDLTATVAGMDADAGQVTEYEPGSTLDITVTAVALDDLAVSTDGVTALVLWEGMVVGQMTAAELAQSGLTLSASESWDNSMSLPLVNCWDGEPLPGGKYELLVSQEFFDSAPVPPVEEPVAPDAPADDTPTTDAEPGVDPDEDMVEPAPSQDLPGERDSESGDGHSGTPGDGDTTAQILPADQSFRSLAEPIPFVVASTVPDAPFAEYLPQPPAPVELPENYLSPQDARDLFNEGVVGGTWDMAPGSHRWVMNNDATTANDPAAWERNFYGCSYDGTSGAAFPERSAVLDLLEVDAQIPSTIGVSYGWVVDGNPLVSVAVTNTSDYALPGFYGQIYPSLYLVQNGRVVAEGYPATLDRHGEVSIYNDDAVDAAVANLGLLEPGASLGGEYLWREVNGCWTESGVSLTVDAGAYTVLTAQSLYVHSGGEMVYYGDMDAELEAVEAEQGSIAEDASAATDPARSLIAPAPASQDYVELQLWWSLGTVTVTD